MAKKSKGRQPNAPELQQILLESPTVRQSPINPYYQDNTSQPPPPYSDLSTAAAAVMPQVNLHQAPVSGYSRLQNNPRQAPATVIVQHQPSISHYDRRAERYHRKVRKYNNEMMLVAIVSIVLSVYAYSLYASRNCIDYIVHKPNKDVVISVFDVRDAQLTVAFGGIFVFLLCLIKCATGESKTYSCYIFLIGLMTLIGTLFTGYLAYLAYYSPCSLKISEIVANAGKSIVGMITDRLPSPDKGVFNESNVFQLAQEDKAGVLIFFLDFFNFVLYLSGFISALLLC